MKNIIILALLCFMPAALQARSGAEEKAAAASFIDALAAGDFPGAAALVDPALQALMPPPVLKRIWQSLEAGYGKFRWRGEPERVPAGAVAACAFEKGEMELFVPLSGSGKVAGLSMNPAQAPGAEAAMITEVAVTVGSGKWALPGTLALPKGGGPFPGAVLVHGSGMADRDETVWPNRMFRDLAQGLAARGVAVLRYDKRNFAHTDLLGESIRTDTVNEETVADAVAAAALLAGRGEVDPARVYVIGHSHGGAMAPRIMRDCGDKCAGFVALAGTTEKAGAAMLRQKTYIYSLDGKISAAEQKDLDDIKAKADAIEDPALAMDGPVIFGAAPAYWLDLRGYFPPEAAKELRKPALILQGERDYQVTMADLAAWKEALAPSGLAEFKSYPKLNHFFMEGEGPSTPAEYARPGRMAGYVMDDIAAWMSAHRDAGAK